MKSFSGILSVFLISGLLTVISAGQEKIIQTDSSSASSAKTSKSAIEAPSDTLPLSPDKGRSIRPVFKTPHIDVSFGFMDGEFPARTASLVPRHKIFVPLSFFADFPVTEYPDISVMGEFGIALGGVAGGNYLLYSALIIYRPDIPCPIIQPFFGIGLGHSRYEFNDGVIIKASQTYPVIGIGVNIVPDRLDVLVLLPATGYLETAFEGSTYTTCLAGPGLKLIWHLRDL